MIITLDLSTPRKLTVEMINELIFRYKMKGNEGYINKESSQKALMCLVLGSQLSVSANTGYSQKNIDLDHMCKYAELYSIPVIYSVYEIIKAKDSLIHTFLGVTRNGRKIRARKNRGA
jgi:hypothetical protein